MVGCGARVRFEKWRFSKLLGYLVEVKEMSEKKDFTVLDVGCGCGFFLRFLKDKQLRGQILAIDISKRLLKKAKVFKSADLIQASAEMLPFKNETFDIITCFQVIEHLSTPTRHLDDVYRILNYGGIYYVTTVNKVILNLLYRFKLFKVDPTHINEMTRRELSQLLKMSNLKIIRVFSVFEGIKAFLPKTLEILIWLESPFGLYTIAITKKESSFLHTQTNNSGKEVENTNLG